MLLPVIEIIIFAIVSFCLYKFFRKRKYQLLSCMAVIAVLFLILLIQFAFLPSGNGVKINYKEGQNLTLEVHTPYGGDDVTAKKGFTGITDTLKAEGEINTDVLGEYTIRYSVEYDGKTYYSDRVIKVVDTTAPELKLEDGLKFSAIDNYDGDITDKVAVTTEKQEDGTYLVKYAVTDSEGNTATAERHVDKVDTEAPKMTLNGNKVKVIMLGETYNDEGAKAQDDMEGDLTSKITSNADEVDTNTTGVYTVTYKAEDSSGNVGEITRNVHVLKKVGYDPNLAKTEDGSSIIHLTFDDGPSANDVTTRNLDTLKKYGVKATFFVVNYGEEGLKTIKREIEEGHTVAIHTYTHDYNKCYGSEDAYFEGVMKMHDKILADTGYDTNIIRFPGGSSNAVSKKYVPGLMTRLTKRMLDAGYLYYDWNVDSTDATTKNQKNADAIYQNVISGLSKGRHNYILMHDIDAKSATADALPRIIEYGLENGYTFEPITSSTPVCAHGINN